MCRCRVIVASHQGRDETRSLKQGIGHGTRRNDAKPNEIAVRYGLGRRVKQ
jgi:hypothetical protein